MKDTSKDIQFSKRDEDENYADYLIDMLIAADKDDKGFMFQQYENVMKGYDIPYCDMAIHELRALCRSRNIFD